ncbi:MAG: Veg family protein [Bacilli bacterium]
MNINKIKDEVCKLLSKKVIIKVNIGRNRKEVYEGTINEVYDRIFIVINGKEKYSFSFVDILTNKISIKVLQ